MDDSRGSTLVSIHAPWEGCDLVRVFSVPASVVSIHAPWEGCDSWSKAGGLGRASFNSRTLGRVRLSPSPVSSQSSEFQFTHPGKGATTQCPRQPAGSCRSFNSRTLGRVRLEDLIQLANSRQVSIHAPWEGCDKILPMAVATPPGFNSRTLGRVRQCGAKVRIIGRINKRNLRLGVLS